MVCISLFHGRTDPAQQMDDWGTEGPVIMNVGFAWTYGLLKVFDILPDGKWGDMIFLPVGDGMIQLDGVFYGDFEIILPDSAIAADTERTKLTFAELKKLTNQ